MATALQTNTTLTTLDLDYNEIGPDDANSFTIALQTNTTLIELNLGFESKTIEKKLNRNKNLPTRIATHITPALRAMELGLLPSRYLPQELYDKIGEYLLHQALLEGDLDY